MVISHCICWRNCCSFELLLDARFAMAVVKPVMLVIDDSCYSLYFKFQQVDILSLKWHAMLDSPSLDFTKKWNVLTPGILKKHFVKPIEFNYSRATEGAVIICFTSGSTFSLDNLKKKNFSLGY